MTELVPSRVTLISAMLARRLEMQADPVKTLAGLDIGAGIPSLSFRAPACAHVCQETSVGLCRRCTHRRLLRAAVIVLEGSRPIRRLRRVTTRYR